MWLFHEAKYGFIAMRRKAYIVSGVVLTLGIGAMVANVALIGSWQNYGVDFTGGVLVQLRFEQPTTDNELREALGGVNAPPITRFGSDNEFVVRAPIQEGVEVAEVAEGIAAQAEATFGEGSFEVMRRESVGPKIGAELQQKALLAVIFSLVLTLLYIAFRFEFRSEWRR